MSTSKRSWTPPVNSKAQTKTTIASPRAKAPSLRTRNPCALVTILVGKDETDTKKFVVHRDFAIHHSPVFEAAFKSQFLEGQTQTYRLEEPSEEAVRMLVHWLYTLELDCSLEGPLPSSNDSIPSDYPSRERQRDIDLTLVQLWVLADKLLIPHLQNKLIQHIEANEKKLARPAYSTFIYVYQNTSDGSPLRKLIVNQSIWSFLYQYKFYEDYFPKEMLWDIFNSLAELRPSGRPANSLREFEIKTTKSRDSMETAKSILRKDSTVITL